MLSSLEAVHFYGCTAKGKVTVPKNLGMNFTLPLPDNYGVFQRPPFSQEIEAGPRFMFFVKTSTMVQGKYCSGEVVSRSNQIRTHAYLQQSV